MGRMLLEETGKSGGALWHARSRFRPTGWLEFEKPTKTKSGFRRSARWHRGPLRETGGSASLFSEGLNQGRVRISLFPNVFGVKR